MSPQAQKPPPHPRLWGVFLLAALCAASVRAEDALHVVDVGHGSCVYLEADGNNYLFDTGSVNTVSHVIDYLSRQGVTSFTAIFLTHNHPDHAGGLKPLLNQLQSEKVFWNGRLPDDKLTRDAISAAKKLSEFQIIKPGATMRLSEEMNLRVLENGLPEKGTGINDDSLVFLLWKGRTKILLPGDIQAARQKDLAAIVPERLARINWILWPHHGDELAPEFMAALGKVRTCVVSTRPDATGLPSPLLATQAKALCGTMVRTDQRGDIAFGWDDMPIMEMLRDE